MGRARQAISYLEAQQRGALYVPTSKRESHPVAKEATQQVHRRNMSGRRSHNGRQWLSLSLGRLQRDSLGTQHKVQVDEALHPPSRQVLTPPAARRGQEDELNVDAGMAARKGAWIGKEGDRRASMPYLADTNNVSARSIQFSLKQLVYLECAPSHRLCSWILSHPLLPSSYRPPAGDTRVKVRNAARRSVQHTRVCSDVRDLDNRKTTQNSGCASQQSHIRDASFSVQHRR